MIATIAVVALGIAGCGEGQNTGEQIERAAENVGKAVQDTVHKAGKKAEQWTDQLTADKKQASNKKDKAVEGRASK
jgi:hypothetical protein